MLDQGNAFLLHLPPLPPGPQTARQTNADSGPRARTSVAPQAGGASQIRLQAAFKALNKLWQSTHAAIMTTTAHSAGVEHQIVEDAVMSDKKERCPRLKINSESCPCTYPNCPRHGLCCECIQYHRQRGELPACYFTAEEERTYNRSIEFYVHRHFKK